MDIRSNGTTFFRPAAMQLARGEDFARGMRSDVTDYRAMLVEMHSRYDWLDGETASERNERVLRNAR